jgi:ABC-type transport system substrate-binding protein
VKAVLAIAVCMSMILGALVITSDRAVAQPRAPRVLNLALQQDMPDFNIWNLASNSIYKFSVLKWGMESLVALDYDGVPCGSLAESWQFDEFSLTWTFHVRHGVLFTDGTSLTADDVVFIYHHVRAGTVYSSGITYAFDADLDGWVSEAEINAAVWKVDDYTVAMKMTNSYGQFLTQTAIIPILPHHIWESHTDIYGIVDILWNDPQAAVGTGPFYYSDGLANEYRIMTKYDGYWGKNLTTPEGYKLYPDNVDQLHFKVFSSMDTAVLALQGGIVDYIITPVTPAVSRTLAPDPNIELAYSADNAYYYLAFNEKLDPFGNIAFRRAISHVIDKDQIVNVYKEGFGLKGSACEPPVWGEWFNVSVNQYPYDPTYAVSNTLLDASGFVDSNGDGWRELPGGSPMQKITILCPPADYDPVRIRAGEMIAKNMRDGLHINAEAKALDFDTLVARLQSMDFQMLIIGWSLTADPVGNVFDILGPKAPANTFGFWSLSDPNPYYKDLYGVSTRADAATQADADEVVRLGNLAKSSFNISDQIKYTKWAEGLIADAVPVNVLYYNVNILAYRGVWTGWVPFIGDLFNSFSLGRLQYTGEPVGIVEATESVNAGLSMPGKVGIGGKAQAYVQVIDSAGQVIPNADVTVSIAGIGTSPPTVSSDNYSGTTDAKGVFEFNLSGISDGYSNVTVTATKNSVTSTVHALIQAVDEVPKTLVLHVLPQRTVLLPGETSLVLMNVTNEKGQAVQGVTISVDPNLIGYGSVDREQVTTDVKGEASINYTAPDAPEVATHLNSHLQVTLSLTVTKTGYAWMDAYSVNLLIFNSAAPEWIMCQVTNVIPMYLHGSVNSTQISLRVTDDEGKSMGNHFVNITYSNDAVVLNPVTQVKTNGAGVAAFNVKFKAGTPSMGLRVRISDETLSNCVPATVTLTYVGSGPAPTMYGGYITWDLPAPYMSPMGALTATAHIWNQTGAPADGIDASLIVSGTPYGTLSWCDLINWDTTWDGWGISVTTQRDGFSTATSGPLNTPFDYDSWNDAYNMGFIYWDWGAMTGVSITGGTLEIAIYGVDVATIDLIGDIYVIPEGFGTYNFSSLAYQIDGATTISGEYVVGRSYEVVAPLYYIADPVLTAKTTDYDESNVQIWAVDQNNLPVDGADVKVYENGMTGNRNYMVIPYSSVAAKWTSAAVTTDVNGFANESVAAIGKNYYVTSTSLEAGVYVRAFNYGAISLFSQSLLFIHTQKCFVNITPITNVQELGNASVIVTVQVRVTDFLGTPLTGMLVEFTAEGGTVLDDVGVTDENGFVNFTLEASSIVGIAAGFIPVHARAGGPAYDACMATMMIPFAYVDRVPPVAEAGPSILAYAGDNVTLNGSSSTDNVGVVDYAWTFTYNGSLVVLHGAVVSFVFDIPGIYPVTLTVKDAMNNSDTDIVQVTVDTAIPEFPSVLLPVLCLAAILLFSRTRGRKFKG